MLEKTFDELRQFLQPAQLSGDSGFEVPLEPGGRCRGDHLLEVGIEHLVRVELRAVAGQVEDLDVLFVLLQPSLDRLAVVNTDVYKRQGIPAAQVALRGAQGLPSAAALPPVAVPYQ